METFGTVSRPRGLWGSRITSVAGFVLIVCCALAVLGCVQGHAQENESTSKKLLTQRVPTSGESAAFFNVSISPASAQIGEEVTLTIAAEIAPGWHIGTTNQEPGSLGFATQIEFESKGLEPMDATFSADKEPQKLELAAGIQSFFEGEFSWTRRYRVRTLEHGIDGKGFIRFQACNDAKCLPPKKVEFEFTQATMVGDSESALTPSYSPSRVNEKTIGEPIIMDLEKCQLTRVRPQLGNIASLLMFGRGKDDMVWKATIPNGPNRGVSIYLPKARKYSLKNTSAGETIVENTATYVSIDQDENGELAIWEATAANRPIRVQDNMYRITDIDTKRNTLTLQQIDIPLQGAIVGFRCPEFEYTSLDGKKISNKTILGKVTVLDLWAVTCHNCYEGFPHLQKCLDKHTGDKLQVILLTVDENREFYDSQAPRLFATYGGGDWPQVMIPGGFNGAVLLGDYGFGSLVVDAEGIVRAVGVVGQQIETVLDDVIALSHPR